ncbi:MAG: sulfatase [Thermodesulfovibrionales bacterium]
MRENRARFPFAVIIALCAMSIHLISGTSCADPVAKPVARFEYTNVILISLQCLRPDHLGVYGYKRETSRNIDKLARRSVVFENAISQANLTPVAQMSVLTSQYPRIHGMVSFEVTQDMVTQRTLPEILKYYNYTTAAAVSSPEFFLRFDSGSGTVVNPGDVFSRFFDYFGRSVRGLDGRNVRRVPNESLQWIKDHKDKKFFLWIASGLIHMPYAASVPPPYRTMYDPPEYTPFWKRIALPSGDITGDEDPSYDVFSRVYRNDFYWGFSPVYHLTENDVKYINARYDAGVYYTDLFIGQLLDLLDSLKLTEKTLLIVQSIHGDDLGEQGNYFHYDVTDTVIKNALIMRFPQGEFGGKRVQEQVQGIDIMPTILNYLDIPVPHEAQGNSLLQLLKGDGSGSPSEFAFIDRMPWWEYNLSKWYLEFQSVRGVHFPPSEKGRLEEYRKMLQTNFDQLDYPPGDIAIRTNDWKLIIRKNRDLLGKVSWWSFITGKKIHVEKVELYDLRKDPYEKANVAKDHPEIVAGLEARLLKWDESIEKQKARYKKDEKRFIIPYP